MNNGSLNATTSYIPLIPIQGSPFPAYDADGAIGKKAVEWSERDKHVAISRCCVAGVSVNNFGNVSLTAFGGCPGRSR
jgi:hypothetical protein